jgi:hypothetical protein
VSKAPRRGWTAYVEEIPATTMLDMPPELSKAVINFIVALAVDAGTAVDADQPPPGDPMDDLGVCYSIQVDREPVIFEYVVLREIREIRIPVLVWVSFP